MPNHTYTDGVPNPPNLPSTDVGAMQTNTNSISAWVEDDHFGFNVANGGYHKQVHLLDQAAPILDGMSGVFYSDTIGGNSWPHWRNALGSFQMLGSDSPNNPSAKLTTPLNLIPNNGWTFLPGGFIYQWGFIGVGFASPFLTTPNYVVGAQTTVTFAVDNPNDSPGNQLNINFPTACINVQATLIYLGFGVADPATVSVTNITTTSFHFISTAGNYAGFYWTAIGW